jgi:serine/threonine-protein kinase
MGNIGFVIFMLGLAGVGIAVMWLRQRAGRGTPLTQQTQKPAGIETARLLDNFEQRFAELKARRPNEEVLGDLYALADQLEKRGRLVQATAVFRHLARTDNSYRDAAVRLARLLDAEHRTPQPAPGPAPAAAPATGLSPAPAAADAASFAGETMPQTALPPLRAQSALLKPEIERLGRYELQREIGRGAMGIVYLGRDSAINRKVAVKVIPLNSECSEAEIAEARMRFFREAETAGRLNHPNIVTIYDVGEERGLAYIAMEYLQGRHLSEYTASARLLEPLKVLDLASRTAAALGFAHKQQIVHRDIKPANLMYEPAGDILKIMDFGIARITGLGNTRTGIVLGTPSFMSPEQLEGQTVTGRSDLFSLGVSLFQLLTGQLPFQADSMTGLMQQIAESPHPPLRAIRPDLPACVGAVIDRALAKDPAARFETGAQMAAALEDCRKELVAATV